jgi:DNA-binding NarL/FixJ family response regulator
MKVLLVDDHTLVRKGVAQVLALTIPGAEITEAADADQAVRELEAGSHDVALLDIRMPGRDGLDLLREIRVSHPNMPVIMLTCFDNSEYVKKALAEGAAGYLLKDCSPEDLVQAISVAMSGSGNVLSPRAVRNLFDSAQAADQQAQSHANRGTEAGLTRRENDIIALLAEGYSNREISRTLFLSEKTVKAHLASIFRKLGVTNRTKAAMAAVAMGMGSSEVQAGAAGNPGFNRGGSYSSGNTNGYGSNGNGNDSNGNGNDKNGGERGGYGYAGVEQLKAAGMRGA